MIETLSTARQLPGLRSGWRRLRPLVVWSGAALAVLAVTLVGAGAWVYQQADTTNVGRLSFANRLRIPPVLEPRLDGQGRKVFDLQLQEGTTELLPGKPASTWGANGSYLGPTLRATRGEDVRVNVSNSLGQQTTIHWHGMHLPAKADGNPHQPINPGTTWSPQWRIDQAAASLWYHPHPHGLTADHVYRGIAGLFLIDDDQVDDLGLPGDYGVDDVPLIIQDKRFNTDGSLNLDEPPFNSVGLLGSKILVNGTYDPYFQVTTRLVRFRLLNASNARVYNIGFADQRAFQLIGTDGGLLEVPHQTTRVQLSPGERAEIVAAFEPGDDVVLRSFEPDLGLDSFEGRFAGGDDTFDLLQVRATGQLGRSAPVPERLAADPDARGVPVRTRRFELEGNSRINGKRMDIGRVDQVVTAGTTEIWEVQNRSNNIHNLHVHEVQFRLAEYGGRPPPPQLSGRKDTVFLPPGKTTRLLVTFGDYSDPATPYMFHCHVLAHEDRGMMGQFVVVEPGQTAALPTQGHTRPGPGHP